MILETMTNQYGSEIEALSITLGDNGVFYACSINCTSSEALGMGTCRCVSHDVWDTWPISRKDVIQEIEDHFWEALGTASSPEIEALKDESLETLINERIILAGFGNQHVFKVALENAYKLGLNPLPKVRELFEGLPIIVQFAYASTSAMTCFEAGPRQAVYAVCLDSDTGTICTEVYDSYSREIPIGDRVKTVDEFGRTWTTQYEWLRITATKDV